MSVPPRGTSADLVLTGTVASFDSDADALPDGAVYLHDGVIEAVQPRRRTAPVGFADARRVATGGSSIRA